MPLRIRAPTIPPPAAQSNPSGRPQTTEAIACQPQSDRTRGVRPLESGEHPVGWNRRRSICEPLRAAVMRPSSATKHNSEVELVVRTSTIAGINLRVASIAPAVESRFDSFYIKKKKNQIKLSV